MKLKCYICGKDIYSRTKMVWLWNYNRRVKRSVQKVYAHLNCHTNGGDEDV